jgi:hypothetical protein
MNVNAKAGSDFATADFMPNIAINRCVWEKLDSQPPRLRE